MRWPALAMVVFCACPPASVTPPPDGGGAGAESVCLLEPAPTSLDFGEVETLSRTTSRILIANHSDRFVATEFPPLELPFSLSAVGPTRLAPSETLVLDVTFEPLDGLLHFADVEVDGGGCSVSVPVRGLGRGGLTATPSMLDFGALEPGQAKTLELTISNGRRVPVTLDGLTIPGEPAEFNFNGAGRIELPALGSTTFTVTASPSAYRPFFATLIGSTGLDQLNVPLVVMGGVPVAQVTPSVIDVPVLGLYPNSIPPSSWEREVIVRNVANDAGARISQLRLAPTRPFKVERLDGGDPSELVVELDPVLQRGVLAGTQRTLVVRMVPLMLGPREYLLTLFTNDPAQPEHVVRISTTVATLPRCYFDAFTPFSILSARPDAGSEGWIRFRNTGFESCTFDDLKLRTGSDPDFRITDGGVNQLTLLPGEEHFVIFEGPDAGTGHDSATFTYQVFNVNSRRQLVPLQVSQ